MIDGYLHQPSFLPNNVQNFHDVTINVANLGGGDYQNPIKGKNSYRQTVDEELC